MYSLIKYLGKQDWLNLRLILIFTVPFAWAHCSLAQPDTAAIGQANYHSEDLFSVGSGAQYGFIFPHSREVQNTKGARPAGAEVILSWQKNDAAAWALCYCFPRQGLLLSYYHFDTPILGKGVNAAYFLEPTYRLTNTTFLSFKGSAGVSYLDNPYHSTTNPANQSYSTAISAYLLFGLGSWFRLNERWWLNPSVNYQHISNGGMRKPNKGINWPTTGIAISYQPKARPYFSGIRTKEKFWLHYSPRWELAAIGTARRGYDLNRNRIRSPLVGLAGQAAKQVGRISAVTLGCEVYQDEELRNELNKNAIDASPVKAGIMAGHEFILGKFLFSQRLGYYIFDQTPYFDQLFHRWGLQYRVNREFGVGFNLLVHRQVAEFIDIRISYSFQKAPR